MIWAREIRNSLAFVAAAEENLRLARHYLDNGTFIASQVEKMQEDVATRKTWLTSELRKAESRESAGPTS